ncbi:Interleukin-17 family [Trinorchestia longiramus]|nr:Interleukin-17 family [Trinorchestia longiramus]
MVGPVRWHLLSYFGVIAATLSSSSDRATAMLVSNGRHMDYQTASQHEMSEIPLGEDGQEGSMGPQWQRLAHRPSSYPDGGVHPGGRDSDALEDYRVAVPQALVLASQVLQQGSNCSRMRVLLHSNTITHDMLLQPPWLHLSPSLGTCPTQYVVRHLGPNFSPSALLEAQCMCNEEPCSTEGHQCVPVARQVPVLHRRGAARSQSIFLQEIVVGCACVLRPGLMGDYIISPWLQN